MIERIHGRDDNDQWTADPVCLSDAVDMVTKKIAVPLTATEMSFPYSSNLKTRDNTGLEKSTERTRTICVTFAEQTQKVSHTSLAGRPSTYVHRLCEK